jgi:predicted outer membrane repeat protein
MVNKRLHVSILLLAAMLALFLPRGARAADAVVGDGTPASCTDAAFNAALLTASNGGGVITFRCGPAVHTIQFILFKVVNLSSVTINGGGRIVLAAGPNERHFFAGQNLRLQNITLQGGDSLVSGGAIEASGAQVILENVQLLNNRSVVSGGAIYCFDGSLTIRNSLISGSRAANGGAIYNDGCQVDIDRSTFTDNRAGATGRGGAVENVSPGVLTSRNSHFNANFALDGGGVYNGSGASATLSAVTFYSNTAGYGGGVENSGTLTVTNSLFDNNNVTGSGGGLWNLNGAARIERSTFSNNFAFEGGGVNSYGTQLEMRDVNLVSNVANALSGTPNGGGLYHAGGTAFITNATIQGNYAANNGGGIYQSSDDNLVLRNVTIAENVATGFGGGLYHLGRYALLTNATLADNQAGTAGNAIYEDSPQTPANPGVVQLANSVIFGYSVNCDGGLFQSLGFNLSKGSCGSLTAVTDRDSFAGDLLLGGLTYNGGNFPMETLLPQAGSPLINAADPAACDATDQRGAARRGTCDQGAVEYGAVAFSIYLPLTRR